jgi:catalase (peroxidase I)
LGHVHPKNSGYDGHPGIDPKSDITINAWDQTPTKFDNGYFVQLFNIVSD